MKRHLSLTCVAAGLGLLFAPESAAAPPPKAAKKACLDCHQKLSKRQVAIWRGSAHARKGVGCAACHGNDHARIVKGLAPVNAKTCGRCHKKALAEHQASRHGMGLHSGWGCTRNLSGRDPKECRFCHEKGSAKPLSTVQCARFLKQSSAMAQVGCNRCHQIERSCAACHTNHATSAQIVRNPNVCAKCHMGPDHPQWEMWKTSKHGTLYRTMGAKHGPNCQTCHWPKKGHNVSRGLTMSPSGKIYGKQKFAARRQQMLTVCTGCHAKAFAKRELARGDQVRRESRAIVAQAKKIIEGLHARGLLDPMPKNRPAHPQRGKTLVLDGQILYEGTSHIERLFFTMKKFYLAQTVKGTYHQNPAYAHWYGNARLKMALVDIKAEASRLARRVAKPAVSRTKAIEQQLRALEQRRAGGEISAAELEKARQRLLRRFLNQKAR